uniref:Uncharacterized protein n=1 Tax=Alexandrium monilatum TaxID=311494 RepID=A0A7S4UVE0_9DINO
MAWVLRWVRSAGQQTFRGTRIEEYLDPEDSEPLKRRGNVAFNPAWYRNNQVPAEHHEEYQMDGLLPMAVPQDPQFQPLPPAPQRAPEGRNERQPGPLVAELLEPGGPADGAPRLPRLPDPEPPESPQAPRARSNSPPRRDLSPGRSRAGPSGSGR